MFRLTLIDLSQNLAQYIARRIKGERKRVVFISASRRLIRFVERELKLEDILNCEFFTVEEFMKYLSFEFFNFSKVHSKLEREFFILNLIKSEFPELYKTLGGKDEQVYFWAKRVSALFNEFDRHLLGEKLENYQYVEAIPKAEELLEHLKSLYKKYEEKYSSVGYNGMFFKKAASIEEEKLSARFKDTKFLIGGVVFLTESEKRLFKKLPDVDFILQTDLLDREKLDVNCSFDTFKAIDRTVKLLGEIPEKESPVGNVKPTEIELCEFSNIHDEANAIVETIKDILRREQDLENPSNLAVILPDASTLFPLLNALDSSIPVNITMGYPFSNTDFGLFLLNLFKLIVDVDVRYKQQNIYVCSSKLLYQLLNSSVADFLVFQEEIQMVKKRLIEANRATYEIGAHDELFLKVIEPFLESKTFNDLYNAFVTLLDGLDKDALQSEENKFLSQMIQMFYREFVDSLPKLGNQEVSPNLALQIVRESVKDMKVPFEGHPLKGVQIMGVLESRGLNFKNVIVADANEGILPEKSKIDPLLPDQIRQALNLYGYKEQEDLVKYYFFRLVYASENALVSYRVGSGGDEKYTKSRFIEQIVLLKELKNEPVRVERYFLKAPAFKRMSNGVEKNEAVQNYIESKLNANNPEDYLSPTEIDTYLTCPYKHYLQRIKKIKPQVTMEEDYEANTVGTIAHEILENSLKKGSYDGKTLNKVRDTVLKCIDKNLARDYLSLLACLGAKNLKSESHKAIVNYLGSLTSFQLEALKTVLKYRLNGLFNLLMGELKSGSIAKFKVVAAEQKLASDRLRVAGRIDRIDMIETKDGKKVIRIVDYKTGSYAKIPARKLSVDEFKLDTYDRDALERVKNRLKSTQLPIYMELSREHFGKNCPKCEFKGCLCLLSKPERDMLACIDYKSDYIELVEFVLEHMKKSKLLYALPGDSCSFCEYRYICRFSI